MPSQLSMDPHFTLLEHASYWPLKANSTTHLKDLNCSYRLSWFQQNLGGVNGGNWGLGASVLATVSVLNKKKTAESSRKEVGLQQEYNTMHSKDKKKNWYF